MEKYFIKRQMTLSVSLKKISSTQTKVLGETKQNSQFRENSQKWRGVIGVVFWAVLQTAI